MTFPALQQNTSIMSVLPTWIETLGRKIDAAESEKAGMRAGFSLFFIDFIVYLCFIFVGQDRILKVGGDRAKAHLSQLRCSYTFMVLQMHLAE